MYPFLVENMADEEAHIQNLNIEVNSKEVCYFMCGENFGRIANYAQTECQFRYCGTAIPFLTVRSTAR